MINSVIIGCGAISPSHEKAITEYGNLYGVCDIKPEKMSRFSCKHFSSIDEVLKDEAVDCVHICTPHYLHADMLKAAVRSSKAVVLEKPVAMNLSEITADYDELNHGKICVMLQNRYNACIKEIKNIISGGKYGKLLGLKGILTWSRDREYYMQDEWRGKWATEGGGLIINQAVHTLDLLEYLGGKAEKIKAAADTWFLGDVIEVEDTGNAVISLENGVNALFYATNGYCTNTGYDIEVVLEKALLRYIWGKLYLCTNNEQMVICSDTGEIHGKKYWGGSHNVVIHNFYESLSGKIADYPGLDDGIASQRLVDGFYKSAKTGETVVF